ncbi:TolC family protein [Opitutaceae bacterium]|nr:TolC family protein [Opitutaceae bacterium]
MSQPALPETVSPQLSEILQQALSQSPRMAIRNADAAAAYADMQTAKSERLPSFGGSASFQKSDENRGDRFGSVPTDRTYYNFSINQVLFKWGEVARNIQNAEIRLAIDQRETRKAYALLASDVRSAYLTLVRARRGLERAQFALSLDDRALNEVREKLAQSIASDVDVYQAEIKQQRSTYNAGIAEDKFLVASALLARLTGTPRLSFEEVPNDIPPPAITQDAEIIVREVAQFLSDAEPTNTDLRKALENLKIQQNNLKNTEVSLRPKFTVSAGVSLDDQTYSRSVLDRYQVESQYVGINVSWSIFDGFATKRRVRSQLSKIRASEIRIEDTRRKLIDNVESHARLLKTLALAVVIDERKLDSAQIQLEAMIESEARGEASEAQIDVLRLGVHDAMGGALYARLNYWNKLSSLLGLIDQDPILNRVPSN